MKTATILFSSLLIFFMLSPPLTARAAESLDMVRLYFEAVKAGDVEMIQSYLAGKLLKKRKVLLEENTEYPKFLRDRFGEAEFGIQASTNEQTVNNREVVNANILFRDGSSITTNLITEKDKFGNWKIIDQLRN